MSETSDQAAPAAVDGQQTAAPTDDTSTEAFDRREAPADDEAEQPEGQDGETPEDKPKPEDDDFEEVEHDGQTHRIPKALKPLVMMQRDYTQKTQAHADQVRQHSEQVAAWEQERTQQTESLSELRAEHVKVGVIEQQVEQANAALDQPVDRNGLKLRDIDWPAYRRAVLATEEGSEDRLVYERLRQAYDGARQDLTDLGQRLDEARTSLKAKTEGLATQRSEAHAAELAKQRQETGKALAEQIPGWNRQLAEEAIRLGVEEYGVKPEEVEVMTDPRLWRLLHDLKTAKSEVSALKKAAQQRTTAQNHERAQQTQPAESGGKGGSNPRDPSTARGDDLEMKSWMERRNKQVAQGGRR